MSNKFLPNAVLFIVAFVLSHLAGVGFLQSARAVAPPPDGGYPGFNTAEGQNALFSLTSGVANTAVGWLSLKGVTTGNFNTGLGAGTLVLNTGDENTAIGTAALLLNSANGNTAVGSRALLNNTTGGTLANIATFGVGPNVAVGQQALESNTVSGSNTAIGYQALHSFVSGGFGIEQLGLNTAVGFQALANSTGIQNTALGNQALFNNTEGFANTAVGLQALFNNTAGIGNVGCGPFALYGNTTGSYNVSVGISAGDGVITANHVICIGTDVVGANVDHSCYIGEIWAQPGGSQAVFVGADGKLGAQVSSRRFKEEIKQMDEASRALFALTPVSFRYKKEIDPTGRAQFGLVAEDVAKVSPDLVISDKEGKPYTVRYDQVNAMLLNEFLKEHKAFVEEQRKVQEQGTTIARLEQQVEALTAGLQKVSTQLELNKAAPRTVLNNQ